MYYLVRSYLNYYIYIYIYICNELNILPIIYYRDCQMYILKKKIFNKLYNIDLYNIYPRKDSKLD